MLVRLGRRGVAVFALGALSVGLVSYAVTASGASPSEPASSCRASVLRVSLAGQVIAEPIIANDPDAPCAPETAGIGTLPTDPLPVELTLLDAETQLGSPQAHAGVADVTLRLSDFDPSLPDITAHVLQAQAKATCTNGNLTRSGSSRVVGLDIDGETVLEVPDTLTDTHYLDIDASPLIRIQLNETDTSVPNTLTQRALHITALPGAADLDVVVSEASVDTTGNPCAGTTTEPPPPPSDVVGWMTGGGQLQADETHNILLPCTTTQKHPKPQLKVETPGGTFNLTKLSGVSCTNDPRQGSSDDAQRAGFNTLTGNGTGSCGKGLGNVPIRFTFTDEGEANQGVDEAHITITGSACAFQGEGTVNGNQQAHRGNNPPA
jgi:hypothetical protein